MKNSIIISLLCLVALGCGRGDADPEQTENTAQVDVGCPLTGFEDVNGRMVDLIDAQISGMLRSTVAGGQVCRAIALVTNDTLKIRAVQITDSGEPIMVVLFIAGFSEMASGTTFVFDGWYDDTGVMGCADYADYRTSDPEWTFDVRAGRVEITAVHPEPGVVTYQYVADFSAHDGFAAYQLRGTFSAKL